jgi:transcriptional regulator with XRE-family HTH domain
LAGMSQLDLARALAVPQPQIARWERAGKFDRMQVGNLKRIALALRVRMEDFFRPDGF